MLSLRPMTETEFAAFKAVSMEDYAQERARNSGLPIEIERDIAERQYAELLKDGVQTRGQYLWKIVTEMDEPVGDLWVAVEEGRKDAFIYFNGIDEPQRGRGYAGEALNLLETKLAALDIHQIGLNVFEDNQVAKHLYQKKGYQFTSHNMVKHF
jgi:RimJ/RimL family protein N-acetyltransferase